MTTHREIFRYAADGDEIVFSGSLAECQSELDRLDPLRINRGGRSGFHVRRPAAKPSQADYDADSRFRATGRSNLDSDLD